MDIVEGKYIIIKEIYKKGGTSTISKVYDLDSDVHMAVKKMQILNEKSNEFLKYDSLSWMRLDKHPNIATFFYYRTDNEGNPLLYIEFIDGCNLYEWITQKKINQIKKYATREQKIILTILSIAIQISSAMRDAHRQNVFHLDLHLGNILVHKNNVMETFPWVAIVDFGFYIKDKENKEELLTLINSDYFINYRKNFLRYPHWPANEEIAIGHFFDCDIWEFGKLLNDIILLCDLNKNQFIKILKEFFNDITNTNLIDNISNLIV